MNVHEFKLPMTLEQVLFEMTEIEERLKTYQGGNKFDLDAWRYLELLSCVQYASHKIKVFDEILKYMSPSMMAWIEPQVRAHLAEHHKNIVRCRLAFSRPTPIPETTP